MDRHEIEQAIAQSLSNFQSKISGDRIIILCPFHAENTPSCSINISDQNYPPGIFRCFGCGEKGNWNKIANALSLPTYKINSSPSKVIYNETKERSPDEQINADGSILDFPMEKWRGISTKVLKKVNAKLYFDEKRKERFVLFPVKVHGEIRGYVKAAMVKSRLSYICLKGKWGNKYGVFPYDTTKGMKGKILVIVEGPRDALRLLRYGIPAVSILGAQNWSESKRNLCLLMDKSIVIAMDGDQAGVKASNMIYNDFLSVGIRPKTLKLMKDSKEAGHKIDPCNMSKERINSLLRLL